MRFDGPLRPLAHLAERGAHGRALVLPGFVTAHSHAFQRGLRGRTQRHAGATGTFWSWRGAMYALAESLTPESLYALSHRAFVELARAGVVAVGEFHYVHHGPDGTPYAERTVLADQVIRAALDAGLAISLLRVAYARAGAGRAPEGVQKRFSDPSPEHVLADVETLRARWKSEPKVRVGIAPHSVRAVPREWLGPLAEHARVHALPLHMHVAEQQGEIDECLAEHGRRPVELLADAGVLSERFCAVHATNLTETEARLLGEAGAQACICPTTERDLGDGLADLALLRAHGVALSVGVDSHVITDHLEEIRALESHERLRLRKRVTFTPPEGRTPAEQLVLEGSANGARAIGFEVRSEARATTWAPSTVVPVEQPALAGVPEDELLDALVFSGSGLAYEREG
jgi:formiminoglutamate deiminase